MKGRPPIQSNRKVSKHNCSDHVSWEEGRAKVYDFVIYSSLKRMGNKCFRARKKKKPIFKGNHFLRPAVNNAYTEQCFGAQFPQTIS